MYYINKLYELGQLSFKTTDPSIIDELLEYYIYDHNISTDINLYNCSIRTIFKVDKDEVNVNRNMMLLKFKKLRFLHKKN